MKILAIESSVKESSIAIMDNGDCYELFSDNKNDTAKSLPILVEDALNKTKNSLTDFNRYKSKWYKLLLFNLYSFKIEYVGDKISSENPSPDAKPLENVVLPEPRSPFKKIIDP